MKTILLVDDESMLAETTAAVLASRGYTVSVAGNGVEGLARLGQSQPDLVILDVRMPLLDGRELRRKMRQDAALQAIPVLFLTATPEALGANELDHSVVLCKPVKIAVLLAVVELLIGAGMEQQPAV
jgi:CheY-like chemotaxis protein